LAVGTVAIVGAGLIAATPVTPPPATIHRVDTVVRLAATSDWSTLIGAAQAEFNQLGSAWNDGVVPLLEQIVANQVKYLRELPNIATILTQIQANQTALLQAPFAPDTDSLDAAHALIYQSLPLARYLPPSLVFISDLAKQLLGFATSPFSGVLFGLASPMLSGLLALGDSLRTIGNDLRATTPDLAGAIATLFNTPAAMTDAFLNGGQTIDVSSLVAAIGPLIGVKFPSGVTVQIKLGGLLSTGTSIFNSLGFGYDLDYNLGGLITGTLSTHFVAGNPSGPFASLIELAKVAAKAIGWDGKSNPLTSLAATTPNAAAATAAISQVPRSVAATLTSASTESTANTDDTSGSEAPTPLPRKFARNALGAAPRHPASAADSAGDTTSGASVSDASADGVDSDLGGSASGQTLGKHARQTGKRGTPASAAVSPSAGTATATAGPGRHTASLGTRNANR
jgi:hypothetical protein